MLIKPKHIERAFIVGTASALVSWIGCLVLLWAWAFDASGSSMLLTLAATMFALATAVRLPPKAARALQRIAAWFRIQDVLAMELAAMQTPRSARREVRAMMRLLAVMTILAVACALASTLAVYSAVGVIDWIALRFVWGPPRHLLRPLL